MKRDPSLHITLSSLVEILTKIEINPRTSRNKMAEQIFYAAQPYQIRDRYLEVMQTKGKARDKVIKSQQADSQISLEKVETFHRTLITHRMSKEFVKAKPILPTDKDYTLLKEVAANAYRFVEHFDFNKPQEGLLEYIKMGLQYMGKKYGLNKFKTYDSRIYEYFEAYIIVATDDDKQGTAEFYQYWKDRMLSYPNMLDIAVNIERDYIKFSHMVYGRQEADELQAHYQDWVEAQFEMLSFLNVIPELGGFHGENAKNRYQKFMNDTVIEEEEKPNDIFKLYGSDSDK